MWMWFSPLPVGSGRNLTKVLSHLGLEFSTWTPLRSHPRLWEESLTTIRLIFGRITNSLACPSFHKSITRSSVVSGLLYWRTEIFQANPSPPFPASSCFSCEGSLPLCPTPARQPVTCPGFFSLPQFHHPISYSVLLCPPQSSIIHPPVSLDPFPCRGRKRREGKVRGRKQSSFSLLSAYSKEFNITQIGSNPT